MVLLEGYCLKHENSFPNWWEGFIKNGSKGIIDNVPVYFNDNKNIHGCYDGRANIFPRNGGMYAEIFLPQTIYNYSELKEAKIRCAIENECIDRENFYIVIEIGNNCTNGYPIEKIVCNKCAMLI